MDRYKQLIREPALLIDLAETLVLMVVAFGVGLSGDQQMYIVAAVIALLGLLKAFMTRPFAVAALTDFGRAALVMFASFGVGITADQITLVVTALGLVASLIVRAQVTPRNSPVVAMGGAGAGPVAGPGYSGGKGELGRGEPAYIGLVTLVIGFLVLVILLT